MNAQEFTTWLGYHFSRFSSAAKQLAALPGEPRFAGDPTQLTVRDAWMACLSDVGLADAQQASDELFREEEPLRFLDDHPRAVRRVARRLSGERLKQTHVRALVVDGEPTMRCPRCRDSGWVGIYLPSTVEAWENGLRWSPETGQDRRAYPYTTAVVCGCGIMPRGGHHARAYDGMRHVLYDPPKSGAEKAAELLAATASQPVRRSEQFIAEEWTA